MPNTSSFLRLLPGSALVLVFLIEGAMAQQAPRAPASPAVVKPAEAPAAEAPARPSASHVATARALVVASGISRSFAVMIPQFMDQIGINLTQTRPELTSDLKKVLTELKPEFDRQADEMVDIAAQIYAKKISEPDLKIAVAFFESPAGRIFVETQPAFLTEVVTAMQGWQGKISTDMMTRVRAEMKKKGHEL